ARSWRGPPKSGRGAPALPPQRLSTTCATSTSGLTAWRRCCGNGLNRPLLGAVEELANAKGFLRRSPMETGLASSHLIRRDASRLGAGADSVSAAADDSPHPSPFGGWGASDLALAPRVGSPKRSRVSTFRVAGCQYCRTRLPSPCCASGLRR